MKKCVKCLQIKKLSNFHIRAANKDGHKNTCKQCISYYMVNYVIQNKERINKNRRKDLKPLVVDDLKVCTSCHISKHVSEFHTQKGKSTGLRSSCKSCRNNENRRYRDRPASKIISREYRKKYLSNPMNVEKRKKSGIVYREKNKEKIKEKNRKHLKANRYKYTAKTARRRAKKLKATPKWLTKNHLTEIRKIYKLAHEIRWLNEEPLHVDHIAPLQGVTVCGLHVPWNLQILTASSNIGKGNRLNP